MVNCVLLLFYCITAFTSDADLCAAICAHCDHCGCYYFEKYKVDYPNAGIHGARSACRNRQDVSFSLGMKRRIHHVANRLPNLLLARIYGGDFGSRQRQKFRERMLSRLGERIHGRRTQTR